MGFFLDTVTVCVNEELKTGSFSNILKSVNVRPIHKDNFYQWVYYHFYQKFRKEWYMSNHELILNLSLMKFCVDSGKHIVHSILYLNY